MRMLRKNEVNNVLGYRIERVSRLNAHNEVAARWYEVLDPETGHVLGHFGQRVEAERDIVARELAAAPRIAA